ncbi:hypothetical protein [Actinophytocola sp.]|uniref:hypothetical protein n=1 Tax=Actinophytocola sp. TaxID=1872138 RepID=UPI002D80A73E|nr:hypothetical protein [Actinophytocola sp.]HET9138856.1 hypothetical protein [Actinophytocola sp.]
MTFTTCPGCGAIAEVVDRFTLPSTAGPVEHIRTHCVHRHWYTTLARQPATDHAD